MTKRNHISAGAHERARCNRIAADCGLATALARDPTPPAPAEAQPPETQITNAPIRDEPESAVRLVFYIQGEASRVCTGVVLSHYWLVTAAHYVRQEVAQDGVFAHNSPDDSVWSRRHGEWPEHLVLQAGRLVLHAPPLRRERRRL